MGGAHLTPRAQMEHGGSGVVGDVVRLGESATHDPSRKNPEAVALEEHPPPITVKRPLRLEG